MSLTERNTGISPLFEAVQLNRVFPDGKTFADCIPQYPEELIRAAWLSRKDKPGFDLKKFVLEHYELPVPHSQHYRSDPRKPVQENIETLWTVLTRQPGTGQGTLVPLPFPYIVPGGRFGEIYYWDSYFTMLGLKESGRYEMIENMINNFSWLIDTLGYIPNGNRQYFIGRSQPPFYSLMLALLAEKKGDGVFITYLPQLEREYRFWMKGTPEPGEKPGASFRTVRLPGGEILNRYYDEQDTPRPESYREDVELAAKSGQPAGELYRQLRAGAESGWDFSSRWFKQKNDFSSIHCTDILPVDLNCLLLKMEQTLAMAYALSNEKEKAAGYQALAEKRKNAIDTYCWNEEAGFYMDYDWQAQKQKNGLTLAGALPLFFSICTPEKAASIHRILREKFLAAGGLLTTTENSGQQWDAPNGWAPLQWMVIRGLEQYGFHDLAAEIAGRWIRLNTDVFKRTGKLMEKYNVVNTGLEAGGGEYEGQDGFGWTNGVLLALISQYGTAD